MKNMYRMNNQTLSIIGCVCAIIIALLIPAVVMAEVTPTEVYYLAFSIDNSLKKMFELSSEYNRERLSDTIYPRNVFQKALEVVSYFNELNIGHIDAGKIEAFKKIDAAARKPQDTVNLLTLIKEQLEAVSAFVEYTGEMSPKTPADAFQMLRQISFHNLEIAKKKSITINWGSPESVYETNLYNILPAIYSIARSEKMEIKPFRFPKYPLKDIYPRYNYKLQEAVYKNIAKYFSAKKGYKPVELLKIKDLDNISVADALDLTHIIIGELKFLAGDNTLDAPLASRYAEWKKGRKIVVGDTVQLVLHNFTLSRKILETVK